MDEMIDVERLSTSDENVKKLAELTVNLLKSESWLLVFVYDYDRVETKVEGGYQISSNLASGAICNLKTTLKQSIDMSTILKNTAIRVDNNIIEHIKKGE